LNRRLSQADWQRRNSTLSDSLSEARNSIRSSTDGLFLPRVTEEQPLEESHWHSAPLGLALLPAIAGIFFQNGSSFVTDVTLLVLAAIFLNWSVRLPWYTTLAPHNVTKYTETNTNRDWYRSTQAIRKESGLSDPTIFEDEAEAKSPDNPEQPHQHHHQKSAAAASKELQIHELAALASCFIFPIIGTWLLHGIRSSLSRPSEGLVSNYNLTIFLLASEVRPVAHLLRLVQSRTIHLQRIVSDAESDPRDTVDQSTIQDVTKRLEELEAHIAETAAARLQSQNQSQHAGAGIGAGSLSLKQQQDHPDSPSLLTQAIAETRRSIQPDIDALNRAVRRYEKRTALSALQTDQRLLQLETKARDAVSLAAAAQRASASRRAGYAVILVDWVCACVVIPAQVFLSIVALPGRIISGCLDSVRRIFMPRKSGSRRERSKGKGGVVGGEVGTQAGLHRQVAAGVQRRVGRKVNGSGIGEGD
jgi:tetrahydromethanopterin S-methyltransferase subunit G